MVCPEGCWWLTNLRVLLLAAQMPVPAGTLFAGENISSFADHSRTPDKSQVSEKSLIFKYCGFMTENNEALLWHFCLVMRRNLAGGTAKEKFAASVGRDVRGQRRQPGLLAAPSAIAHHNEPERAHPAPRTS